MLLALPPPPPTSRRADNSPLSCGRGRSSRSGSAKGPRPPPVLGTAASPAAGTSRPNSSMGMVGDYDSVVFNKRAGAGCWVYTRGRLVEGGTIGK